ncbi:Calx-beta domain-containing protein [Azospirillum argentinense]
MIIAQDAVWDSNQFTDAIIQVAPGATLTVGPGAVLNNKIIQVFGNLQVVGSAEQPAILNNVYINYGSTTTSYQPGRIDVSHALWNGGGMLDLAMGSGYGSFSLKDSELNGLQNYIYVWYPEENVDVERNVFRNSGGFYVGINDGKTVSIKNNVFIDQTTYYAVENWAMYGTSKLLVQYNSFLSTNKVALSLAYQFTNAAMIADHNWFGTVDPAIINAMVMDRNDNLNYAGFISVDPILTAPDPNTPCMLSVSVDSAIVDEGGVGANPFTFTVTRTGDSSGVSTVAYTVVGSGSAAANPADFVGNAFPSGVVHFAAGESSKTVTIQIAGDTDYEPDETFSIVLSSPVRAALERSSVNVVIRNDDVQPTPPVETTPTPQPPADNPHVGAAPLLERYVDGRADRVTASVYEGPVTYLQWQHLGDERGEVIAGSSGNDFINLFGGDDAASGGDGDDVLDGGTGSNFLSGGSGQDTFFVDGRGGGVTWSTVTDLEKGEWATIWGFREGVSKLTWQDMSGTDGFKGATAFCDLDGNGSIDAAMTFAGVAVSALMSASWTMGDSPYLAITLK